MAYPTKRFIYALNTNWYNNESTNKTTYKDSVVFIHDKDGKGVEIFTQGAYFKTDVQLSDIEPLIKAYLKEGSNITITTDSNNDLVIAAKSVDSLTGKSTSTDLVQAQAVAGALTTPVQLTLAVANGVGTFSETFTTLNGDTTQAVTAVFEAGDNITLTKGTNGLKIAGTPDTKLKSATISAGEITAVEGTVAVVSNVETGLSGTDGESISGKFTAVNVPTKTYVDNLVSNKNVSAEGDDYVTAIASGNKVTVAATKKTTDSLALADSALQKADITEGKTNGTISVEGTDVAVKGLGFAAYTDSTAYDASGAADAVKTTLLGDAKTYTTLGALEDAVEAINAGAKSYTVREVKEGLGANVETAYQLYEKVGENETAVGSLINIPKDDSLVDVKTTTDEKGNKVVVFEYNLADGTKKEITLDLADYVTESEFGNGIEVVDGVASVKVKEGETYLKVGVDGVYTEGIDTAISNAIIALDSEKEADATATSKHNDEIAVVTGVKVSQVDGKISGVTVDSGLAATKKYVDDAVAAKDIAITAVVEGSTNITATGGNHSVTLNVTESIFSGDTLTAGLTTNAAVESYVAHVISGLDSSIEASTNATEPAEGDTVAVLTGVTMENGALLSDESTSVLVPTKSYVDSKVGAVQLVDNGTDGNQNQFIDSLSVSGTTITTTVKYVDQAKLVDYTEPTVKYIGITKEDTIASAFEKCESAWDWGTI